jgi:D-sedoheptulose 7-phosphate isomerase
MKKISKWARLIRDAKHVYMCGNGGSAMNATHIVNDLISVDVKAYSLAADMGTFSAIANDYGYDMVFDRQIRVFAEPGDLLICLSGSGKSVNIIKAIERAKAKGMTTLSIIGAYNDPPPRVATISHYCIRKGRDMQDAEQYQILWGHSMMRQLRKET